MTAVKLEAARLGPLRAQRPPGKAPGGHLRHVSQLVLVVGGKKSVAIYDDDDLAHNVARTYFKVPSRKLHLSVTERDSVAKLEEKVLLRNLLQQLCFVCTGATIRERDESRAAQCRRDVHYFI